MPHLSVSTVVPTYNRAPLLELAVRSALPQCEPGDEIIVVDDGSTDDTEAVATSFGPPVVYLRTPHLGAGAARNAGVRAASGDLVALLDSDDEWMPGKLAAQRAIMAGFPDVLFVFSDFGMITPTGRRRHHGLLSWSEAALRPWGAILGDGIPSGEIPGLPPDAPSFGLHVGHLYEAFIWTWCVFTGTVIVRREEAGDALFFPEDVPTYEDLECYARLARRGIAGYMDCETAWHRYHAGAQLTDADKGTNAETALTIIGRVWGADAEYLMRHRNEYEVVMDAHRSRKVRYLLGRGRSWEARKELAQFFYAPPRSQRALSYVPGNLMSLVAGIRRRHYALRERPW
jgi:glycosyltransferase involved in cell wall biosynthesis